MYRKNKVEYVDFKTINKHLKYCFSMREIHYREKESRENIGLKAFIVDRLKHFELTYSYGGAPCTYIFDKARGDTDDHQQITGLQAFAMLNRFTHINRCIEKKEDAPFSIKPILWKNPKYEGQRLDAICYDMNSAYSYAMLQPMPDTSVPPEAKNVEEGEIGFDLDGNRQTSGYSLFVFKLIESPFKEFVYHYYKKKYKAKTPAEKRKAKEYLNFCIGFLQLRDPFTRSQIIGLANDLIKSLIDDNTLYCNTDSIVSMTERPDLKLGNDIGEWKIEHKGKFAYLGFNYQWDYEIPSIRGKPKTDFDIGWDLLNDPLPDNGNYYKFNPVKGEMELCN